MQELSQQHIERITETIDRSGISFSHLREDLIDHICCEIEAQLAAGIQFNKAFESIRHNIGIKSLQQVQEKTLLLIDKNYCAMKSTMKFSGILSTIFLMVGTLFKINHWPGGSILLALGFVTLCLIFLPAANYMMHRENKDRSMILLFLSAILGGGLFFAGILFKVQHWPGSGTVMTAGTLLICLLFLPLLLRYLFRIAESRKEKLAYSFGVISGIVFFLGFLFKFMHWPGGSLLLGLAALLLAVLFIPFYTWVKYAQAKHVEVSYIYIIAALTWICMIIMLVSLTRTNYIMQGFSGNQQQLQLQNDVFRAQNESLYTKVLKGEDSSSFKKTKDLADNLDNYIQELKIEILRNLDEENPGNLEKIDLSRLEDNTNSRAGFMVMIGENRTGKAYELKKKLITTRDEYLNLVNQDETTGLIIRACFNTNVPEGVPEWFDTWELVYFDRASVVGCFEVLTAIQRNLRLAENEVIAFLMNS